MSQATRTIVMPASWRFLLALLLLLAPVLASSGTTPQWNATFLEMHGPTGPVGPMAVWDDGSGEALYAGMGVNASNGLFRAAGGLRTEWIARWNGVGWSALAAGLDGPPSALIAFGDALVAGGSFTRAGEVPVSGAAAWDGRRWRAMGSQMNSINALAVYDGQLYAAGVVRRANGVLVSNVVRWDGEEWQETGLAPNQPVNALVVYQGMLTAAGLFSEIGGIAARVAVWNGQQWSPLPSANSIGQVNHLVVHGQELVAAGGGPLLVGSNGRLARYDGQRWNPIDFQANPLALGSYGGQLLVGTSFGGIAIPDTPPFGTPWQGGTSSGVRSMLVHGGRLFVGGAFGRAGSILANRIAVFDSGGWQSLGAGFDGAPFKFLDIEGDLLAGGTFRGGSGALSQGVMRWNGEQWAAVGEGFHGRVFDLTLFGGELVAAGELPNSSPNNYGVQRWDGQQWITLGSGMNSFVNAIVEHAGVLVAGGSFNQADGAPVDNVAVWNGQDWSAMASPPLSQVAELMVHEGQLYALGQAESQSTPVARWDGQAWTSMGPTDPVFWMRAAASFEGDLVVGASARSDFPDSPRVQRLRAGVWEPMGTLDFNVNSLIVHEGQLYAAGTRPDASEVPVMRWNGSAWEAFGAPADMGVIALGIHGGQLLAGGNFSRIGDRVLPFIAAYGPAHDTTVEIVGVSASPAAPGQAVEFTVEVTAAIAPARGHVTITGSPGGSCTDLTLDVLDGTRAQARCSITWNQACNREIVADYVGASSHGTVWQSSRSAPVVLPMTGAPVCSEVTMFGDGFE
jgi:hypothetical protein